MAAPVLAVVKRCGASSGRYRPIVGGRSCHYGGALSLLLVVHLAVLLPCVRWAHRGGSRTLGGVGEALVPAGATLALPATGWLLGAAPCAVLLWPSSAVVMGFKVSPRSRMVGLDLGLTGYYP
jgi:hypothetical protein